MSKLLNVSTAGITPGIDTSFSIPFKPSEVQFLVSELIATPENGTNHISIGTIDEDGVTVAHSVMTSDISLSRRSEAYAVSHYAIVSSASRRVVSATFVSMSSTALVLNFDRADSGYKIDIILRR